MPFAGHRTRAQLGLTPSRSVSRNITPARGGVAVHYGGGSQGITQATPHTRCEAVWRGWQSFHKGGRGWADIAYTGGFCQHGYAFAGRGAGVRTAANGTNTGNQYYYAVVFLGGAGDVPSDAAVAALKWWVATLRKSGAGDRVVGHRDLFSTACPGEHLLRVARSLDRRRVDATGDPGPGPERRFPGAVLEDGRWGGETARGLAKALGVTTWKGPGSYWGQVAAKLGVDPVGLREVDRVKAPTWAVKVALLRWAGKLDPHKIGFDGREYAGTRRVQHVINDVLEKKTAEARK